VRCALARSVCRGVVCGDLSAGLSGPAVAGGLVWPCWTILVALYARVRPFARVELPAERVSIRVVNTPIFRGVFWSGDVLLGCLMCPNHLALHGMRRAVQLSLKKSM
jgi:hypothetical protein